MCHEEEEEEGRGFRPRGRCVPALLCGVRKRAACGRDAAVRPPGARPWFPCDGLEGNGQGKTARTSASRPAHVRESSAGAPTNLQPSCTLPKSSSNTFHVGCAYQSPEIFARTFDRARAVFDTAANLGNHMSVLDIGGGFPGGLRNRDKFNKVCDSIRIATDRHFPTSSGVELIAEPGQFFVTSAYALVTRVVGKRRREILVDGTSQVHQDVFINETKDNCILSHLYEYFDVKTWPLEEPMERPRDVLTTIWGATCNPVDCIESRRLHFDVRVDEWLLMDNLGAYSLSRASGFNGFPFPVVHYIAPAEAAAFVLGVLDRSPLRSGYAQPETVLKRTASASVAASGEEQRRNAGADERATSVFTRSHLGLAFREGTL